MIDLSQSLRLCDEPRPVLLILMTGLMSQFDDDVFQQRRMESSEDRGLPAHADGFQNKILADDC